MKGTWESVRNKGTASPRASTERYSVAVVPSAGALRLHSARPVAAPTRRNSGIGSLATSRAMSYAAKAKGFRSITVEGVRYRWRFVAGKVASSVTLQGCESGFQQAVAVLRGVRDPWLAFSDRAARFTTISPGTVRCMIRRG
jgi:hypothetical protein